MTPRAVRFINNLTHTKGAFAGQPFVLAAVAGAHRAATLPHAARWTPASTGRRC